MLKDDMANWDFLCDYHFFQSVVMLVFREEKSPEDETKAWQFWHSRQHSVKQRILDAGKSTRHFFFAFFLKVLVKS